jgi:hypothetical protein
MNECDRWLVYPMAGRRSTETPLQGFGVVMGLVATGDLLVSRNLLFDSALTNFFETNSFK